MYKFIIFAAALILIRTIDDYFMEPYKTACFNNAKNGQPNVTIVYGIYNDDDMNFLEKQLMTINKNNVRVHVTMIAYTEEENEWFSVEDDLRNCQNGGYISYSRIQNCIVDSNIALHKKIHISTCIWRLTKAFGQQTSYPSLSLCARSPSVYNDIENCIRKCPETNRSVDERFAAVSLNKHPLLIINNKTIENATYDDAIENFSRFLKVNYGSYDCRFYGPSYKTFIVPYLNFLTIVILVVVFVCDVLCSSDQFFPMPLSKKEIYYSIQNV